MSKSQVALSKANCIPYDGAGRRASSIGEDNLDQMPRFLFCALLHAIATPAVSCLHFTCSIHLVSAFSVSSPATKSPSIVCCVRHFSHFQGRGYGPDGILRATQNVLTRLMASKLVEATTFRRAIAPTPASSSWNQKGASISRVRITPSLSASVASSFTGTTTHTSGRKLAKRSIRMASTQGAETEVGTEKWTIPDSKGLGYETTVQVTPRDVWYWQADTHWKHWHGFWIHYQPDKGNDVVKEYKSVRSLQIVDPERTKLFHRNQWYDAKGFGKDVSWEYGPWHMTLEDHSLPDGILHPNSKDHRVLLVPNGNLGWIARYLKPNDPRSVIFSEPMFYINPKQRISVPVGYDSEGVLGVALLLEEVKDSEVKLDSSWSGTLWKHSRDPLLDTREEPKGRFRGHEESISPQLEWKLREAEWQGFKGGLSDDEAANYVLVYMPNNVTVFAPKKAAVHKDFSFYITYVENESRVRVMSVAYGADLNLAYVKAGVYDKVED